MKPKIAVIGAGAAGLMAAEVLSSYPVSVHVYDHKPTAARKILMAGKTGLNISHSEPFGTFVNRYTPNDWLTGYLESFHADQIVAWMNSLGIKSYIGSSGRIFPVEMKASKLIRAWLSRLDGQGVQFYYRHRCTQISGRVLSFDKLDAKAEVIDSFYADYDAVILACGGGSYRALGSDGAWQQWFDKDCLTPLYASNVGVLVEWSSFMAPLFGQPLKRVRISVGGESHQGDVIISHYGLESGLIYRLNQAMRQSQHENGFGLSVDLMPDKSVDAIYQTLSQAKRKSLNTLLKKAGLDAVKIAVLRECTPKSDWSDAVKMAKHIKNLTIQATGFRPMDEAISTGGGIKRMALDDDLQLICEPGVFCAGEMLDWDAPTGGYLLTACLATGRAAAYGVLRFLNIDQ
ncbi:TIGR03862 family flavoprotein [Moraxella canis]|uniref:TIGR03862 family flavoprotein n=1 Tax=Moraxella canis TaxID=90239 RepID=A0ABZ0WY93_9GAMM|nr:TIGR03862 family flavoprotein [Moraxella canis]WQE04010.1 TIGR03862 family flavoprotein [Moraxella canis]